MSVPRIKRIINDHVNGYTSFVEVSEYAPSEFCITRTSTFEKSIHPDDERKVDQFFVNVGELNTLISILQSAQQGQYD